MPISSQVRLLQGKWQSRRGWPKFLAALEINGIRGWAGGMIPFDFPLVAISGENGAGKSTIIQAAAAVYKMPKESGRKRKHYASDFFPDTAWDQIRDASIQAHVREGNSSLQPYSVRKPTTRWRGNLERRERHVEYIDLARIQPLGARVGYSRLAKASFHEAVSEDFGEDVAARLSEIIGKKYLNVRRALSSGDDKRWIPVLNPEASPQNSGFHHGAGELTASEFISNLSKMPRYSLVVIDEIETSLHPRTQRRLIRDLARLCRELELQVIITTHSPFILEELPVEARGYILQEQGKKQVVFGVSPEFAMSKMDDEFHPECDLFVEDERAKSMLLEILTAHERALVMRSQVIPYGAASVGFSLGQMVAARRFPRPTVVFVDGDQENRPGCITLPGEDAPERVVFNALRRKEWGALHSRLGRPFAETSDACSRAMVAQDHKEWVGAAASSLTVGGDNLWQAMCAEWAMTCMTEAEIRQVLDSVRSVLETI